MVGKTCFVNNFLIRFKNVLLTFIIEKHRRNRCILFRFLQQLICFSGRKTRCSVQGKERIHSAHSEEQAECIMLFGFRPAEPVYPGPA
jgi:hypothetical protein